MARTIAEVLAYNRAYSPKLNPIIFDEDGVMHPEVRDKIIEIVDAFLDYTQIKDDVKISDIRVVGSNASYNYNENSDLDIHIVTDLSKISKPETIAQLYFTEVKHAFKEAYDITIKGIDVEMYVEDVNASAVTNGIYSVSQDKWIKEPEKMKDPTESELSQAEAIEDEIIAKLEKADEEEAENIIDKLYIMRKDALASVGETAPANLAFKSLRNKGILKRAKDDIKKQVSKRLSLEGKKVRESIGFDELKYNLFSSTPNYNRFFNEVAKLIRDIPYEEIASGITVYKNDFNIEIPKDYISKLARDMKSSGYVTRVSASGLGVRISARSDENKKMRESVIPSTKSELSDYRYQFDVTAGNPTWGYNVLESATKLGILKIRNAQLKNPNTGNYYTGTYNFYVCKNKEDATSLKMELKRRGIVATVDDKYVRPINWDEVGDFYIETIADGGGAKSVKITESRRRRVCRS